MRGGAPCTAAGRVFALAASDRYGLIATALHGKPSFRVRFFVQAQELLGAAQVDHPQLIQHPHSRHWLHDHRHQYIGHFICPWLHYSCQISALLQEPIAIADQSVYISWGTPLFTHFTAGPHGAARWAFIVQCAGTCDGGGARGHDVSSHSGIQRWNLSVCTQVAVRSACTALSSIDVLGIQVSEICIEVPSISEGPLCGWQALQVGACQLCMLQQERAGSSTQMPGSSTNGCMLLFAVQRPAAGCAKLQCYRCHCPDSSPGLPLLPCICRPATT
jgi:hypothetical protein